MVAAGTLPALPVEALADPLPVRVIAFASPALLPVYAAIDRGFYARENVVVTVTTTPGSIYQFQHFSAGDFDVATTAMDNVIAYDAGQGEAPLANPPDFVAICGGDNGFLRFYGRPEIQTAAALKGKTLGVDAVSTGYAFVLRAMLAASGLHDADYTLLPLGNTPARLKALVDGTVAATIISAPFDHQADAQGMRSLGDVYRTIGPYQGVVHATRRTWLRDHAATVQAYLRGTHAGLAWAFAPAHRDEALALLVSRGGMTADVAAVMLPLMLAPGGMNPTGAIDVAGVRNVLALRGRYATPAKKLGDPRDYYDGASM